MNYFWGFVCIFIYVDVLSMSMFENFEISKFVRFFKLICGFLCVFYVCTTVIVTATRQYVKRFNGLLDVFTDKKNDCIMHY